MGVRSGVGRREEGRTRVAVLRLDRSARPSDRSIGPSRPLYNRTVRYSCELGQSRGARSVLTFEAGASSRLTETYLARTA